MSGQEKIYLVHGKRTPFGKFGGSLKDVTPVDLAVHAAKSLISEIKLDVGTIIAATGYDPFDPSGIYQYGVKA